MQKLAIFLICSLLSIPVIAGCVIKPLEGCFYEGTKCAENEIIDVTGLCHSCLEKDPIHVCSIAKEEIQKRCPNRHFGLSDNYSFLEKTECPKNHFMADDAKCYPCDYDDPIKTKYLKKELSDICPNRLWMSCGDTVAHCPPGYQQEGQYCVWMCKEGYVKTKTGSCCNPNGDCYTIYD